MSSEAMAAFPDVFDVLPIQRRPWRGVLIAIVVAVILSLITLFALTTDVFVRGTLKDIHGSEAAALEDLKRADIAVLDHQILCSGRKRVHVKVSWIHERHQYAVVGLRVVSISKEELLPYLDRFPSLREIRGLHLKAPDKADFHKRFPRINWVECSS